MMYVLIMAAGDHSSTQVPTGAVVPRIIDDAVAFEGYLPDGRDSGVADPAGTTCR
jgi:hypothetical protein